MPCAAVAHIKQVLSGLSGYAQYESRLTVQAEDSEGEDLGNESDEDRNEDDQEVDINDGDNYIIDSR